MGRVNWQSGGRYLCINVVVENHYGLQLNTTTKTTLLKQDEQIEIIWNDHNGTSETQKMFCLNILSVKVNLYLEYLHGSCKQKVTFSEMEKMMVKKSLF